MPKHSQTLLIDVDQRLKLDLLHTRMRVPKNVLMREALDDLFIKYQEKLNDDRGNPAAAGED